MRKQFSGAIDALIVIQSVIRGWLVRKCSGNIGLLNFGDKTGNESDEVLVKASYLAELQRRVLKAEAALREKEEENEILHQRLRQYENRWSDYELNMKSMEEVWQKQMRSLQSSLSIAKKSLAVDDSARHSDASVNASDEREYLQKSRKPVHIRDAFHSSILHFFLRLVTVFMMGDSLCLIMESLISDLDHILFPINAHQIKIWMYDIVSAVAFLHERNVIHRDLKPANILMDKKNRLKLVDFGLSRGHVLPGAQVTPLEATPAFSAPEVLLGSHTYGTSIDMWSVGCVFYYLIEGEPPFSSSLSFVAGLFETKSSSNDLQRTKILDNIFRILGTPTEASWPGVSKLPHYRKEGENYSSEGLHVSSVVEEEGLDLLERLLCVRPDSRISAQDALNHPYFQGLKREKP